MFYDFKIISDNLDCVDNMEYILSEVLSPLFQDSYIKYGECELEYDDGSECDDTYCYQFFLMHEDKVLFEYYRYNLIPHIDNLNELYGMFWQGIFISFAEEIDYNDVIVRCYNDKNIEKIRLMPEKDCVRDKKHDKDIINAFNILISSDTNNDNSNAIKLAKDIINQYYKTYDTEFSYNKIWLMKYINPLTEIDSKDYKVGISYLSDKVFNASI